MKISSLALAVILHSVFGALIFVSAAAAETVVVTPKNTDEALVNPGMGWVYYHYSNRLWAYGARTAPGDTLDWFPGVSTIYLRVLWSDLEPEEGVYRWDIFDSVAQPWIDKGKKIAIRVICCNQTENASPDWVRAAGAKGIWFRYRKHGVPADFPLRWEPVYDDPVFLEKFSAFLKAFAARYDGSPSVAFVDVGSFGMYGEGHTGDTSKLSKEETERITRLHIDLWKKHLPRTYLVISDDVAGAGDPAPDSPMMKYARENGVGFRDDSIFCFRPEKTKLRPAGSWMHDGWARLFAPTLPVIVETGHYCACAADGKWIPDRYLECVESYQASYMSIHDYPDLHLKLCKKEIDQINKRLGYRFELRKAEYPDTVKTGDAVKIVSTWVNAGVAWCCRGASLTWNLVNDKGTVCWSVTDPAFDFKRIDPTLGRVEKPVTVESTCRFGFTKKNPDPDNCLTWARNTGRDPGEYTVMLKPGTYTLAVSVGSKQGSPEIALPLKGGNRRRYPVGSITVTEGSRSGKGATSRLSFSATAL